MGGTWTILSRRFIEEWRAAASYSDAVITPPPSPPAPPPYTSSPLASPTPSAGAVPGVLTASPSALALHPGDRGVVVTISGGAGPLTATAQSGLVSVKAGAVPEALSVDAQARIGADVIRAVDAAGDTVDVPVRVARDAGTVSPAATLRVTGSPIDPAWLAAQVSRLVASLAVAQPTARVTVAPIAPLVAPSPGAVQQLAVPVQVSGDPSYYDVNASTNVTVQNVAAGPFEPPLLMYDDDPERLVADGVVYRGTVAGSARLYYYHDDGAQPRRLVVLLSAPVRSDVQVIDSSSGPNLDVMSVGHAASKNFLMMKPRNEGVIVPVAPASPAVLHDFTMTYRQGVAGSIGLNVIDGGPVTVTVVSASPGTDPLSLANGPVLPGDGHHRTGLFAIDGYGTASVQFSAGGPNATVVYGDREPTPRNVDASAAGHDYGDYGVVWNVNFTLQNQTAQPASAYLYERPIGGIVRSSFLVDGTMVDMGCTRLSVPYQIAAYQLAPNQTYRLNVMTMTDGGSNYPLELGVTSVAPTPTPPPISAPEGCFPKPPSPSPSISPSPAISTSPPPLPSPPPA